MRQPSRLVTTLAGLALIAIAAPCMAGSMRCGNFLITDGDTSGKLRSRCGEPAAVSRTTIKRAAVVWIRGRPFTAAGYEAVEVPVETWEYNFGPRRLILRVRIEDGMVVSIDTLGYGYP